MYVHRKSIVKGNAILAIIWFDWYILFIYLYAYLVYGYKQHRETQTYILSVVRLNIEISLDPHYTI